MTLQVLIKEGVTTAQSVRHILTELAANLQSVPDLAGGPHGELYAKLIRQRLESLAASLEELPQIPAH
jgi:hypothetical protein